MGSPHVPRYPRSRSATPHALRGESRTRIPRPSWSWRGELHESPFSSAASLNTQRGSREVHTPRATHVPGRRPHTHCGGKLRTRTPRPSISWRGELRESPDSSAASLNILRGSREVHTPHTTHVLCRRLHTRCGGKLRTRTPRPSRPPSLRLGRPLTTSGHPVFDTRRALRLPPQSTRSP
ncbi:MAG: hypothetical protein RIS76_1570 [Verrucomicrobiota bacterium]